ILAGAMANSRELLSLNHKVNIGSMEGVLIFPFVLIATVHTRMCSLIPFFLFLQLRVSIQGKLLTKEQPDPMLEKADNLEDSFLRQLQQHHPAVDQVTQSQNSLLNHFNKLRVFSQKDLRHLLCKPQSRPASIKTRARPTAPSGGRGRKLQF
uniref:Uncharacterized protein n=1 Tax=Fundulus heteroclitus TaxID=8078 RepID=A0A3Q2SS43_FUNHE